MFQNIKDSIFQPYSSRKIMQFMKSKTSLNVEDSDTTKNSVVVVTEFG